MSNRRTQDTACTRLRQWHRQLQSRRSFLKTLAGGSLLALFRPLPALTDGMAADESTALSSTERWRLIEQVQQQLLPSEEQAPGARDINALAYLQWVAGDEQIDAEERAFILQGAQWLHDLSIETHQGSFNTLSEAQQEAMLKIIAASDAGENWLATLMLYIFEALLADPVYGGNPDGIGWRWLDHDPGQPRPPANKRYGVL